MKGSVGQLARPNLREIMTNCLTPSQQAEQTKPGMRYGHPYWVKGVEVNLFLKVEKNGNSGKVRFAKDSQASTVCPHPL